MAMPAAGSPGFAGTERGPLPPDFWFSGHRLIATGNLVMMLPAVARKDFGVKRHADAGPVVGVAEQDSQRLAIVVQACTGHRDRVKAVLAVGADGHALIIALMQGHATAGTRPTGSQGARRRALHLLPTIGRRPGPIRRCRNRSTWILRSMTWTQRKRRLSGWGHAPRLSSRSGPMADPC